MARNIATYGVITDHGKGCHIERDRLPKVNGVPIDGVWSPDTFCKDERVLDDTNWSLSTPNPFTDTKSIDSIGTIPQEFKDLLGWQVIQGKKVFVNNISFRTDSSGNAMIDWFMTIYGYDYNKSAWRSDDDKMLNQNDPYVKSWLALCDKSFIIKYVPNPDQTFELTFPKPKLKSYNGTFIKKTGGFFYPTMFSERWIPFGHKPYITYDNCKNIRVLDTNLNAHVYIQEVDEKDIKKGDDELIRLSFHRDEGLYYCFIVNWKDTKDYVKYKVDTIHKNGDVTVRTYRNDNEKGKKERRWKSGFYKVMSISRF